MKMSSNLYLERSVGRSTHKTVAYQGSRHRPVVACEAERVASHVGQHNCGVLGFLNLNMQTHTASHGSLPFRLHFVQCYRCLSPQRFSSSCCGRTACARANENLGLNTNQPDWVSRIPSSLELALRSSLDLRLRPGGRLTTCSLCSLEPIPHTALQMARTLDCFVKDTKLLSYIHAGTLACAGYAVKCIALSGHRHDQYQEHSPTSLDLSIRSQFAFEDHIIRTEQPQITMATRVEIVAASFSGDEPKVEPLPTTDEPAEHDTQGSEDPDDAVAGAGRGDTAPAGDKAIEKSSATALRDIIEDAITDDESDDEAMADDLNRQMRYKSIADSIGKRMKKASKRNMQAMSYMMLTEDRIRYLERKVHKLEIKGEPPALPEEPVTHIKMKPEVCHMSWKDFLEASEPDPNKPGYVLDVLAEAPHTPDDPS